jgi:hypothetical protein
MCDKQAEGLNEILVPMITWDLDGYCLNPDSTEVRESLRAIIKYSVFQVSERVWGEDWMLMRGKRHNILRGIPWSGEFDRGFCFAG